MTERTRPSTSITFPRRDADGRVTGAVDLLLAVIAGVLLTGLALVLVDGLFTLLGAGPFGHVSGWLTGILPVWLFAEEYRAWRPVRLRPVLAGFAAVMGFAAGGLVASLTGGWPVLATGGLGVTVAALVYAIIWYAGIRWLADRVGQG
jgi:hypothetical protein